MADQRITQLTPLPKAGVAATDVLPIADISASQTKKVTAKDLVDAGLDLIDVSSIDIDKLDQASATKLGTTALADDAVTAAKLANDSSIAVQTTAPASDNFEGRGHFNASTGNLQIFDGSAYQQVVMPTAGIGDLQVATGKLADGAVTTVKVTALGTAAYADSSVTTAKLADGAVTAVKIATDSITATQIAPNAVGASELADDAVDTAAIQALAVTEAKLAGGAVTEAKLADLAVTDAKIAATTITYGKLNLADGSVPGAKLVNDSVTSVQIAAGAVQSSELANDAVTTDKIADDAITADQLATNSVTADAIAAGEVGTSELASDAVTYDKLQNVSATDRLLGRSAAGAGNVEEITCTAAGRALLDDADAAAQRTTLGLGTLATQDGTFSGTHSGTSSGTNTGDQTITLTGDITGTGTGSFATAITASAVTEAAIATNAISTGKILDDAVTAAKLANDSTTIVNAGTPFGSGAFEGQHWFDTNTNVEYVWDGAAWIRQAAINTLTFTDSTPIAFSVAYPDQYSATITTTLDTQVANRALLGPVSGADAAPTFRDIEPDDLPDATSSTKGIIQPGTGLAVNAGILNHSNSATAGTYTKVTVDAQGHVTVGAQLDAADVPVLDAAKITTGELPTDRLADAAITIDKLADYSTSSIGEAFPIATFIGQLHLNPLDRAFYMWDGNVYVPIGISAGQILLAGTFDASSPAGVGSVQSVTPDGAAAGFVVGDPLPVSTLTNNKYYFVVSEGGTITSGNAPNVTLAPPDLCLSVFSDANPQWVEIDVSSGAGAIAASNVSFNPAASLGATNVQTALEEVSTECRNATNITSGTLAVERGGTGVASYAKGDILGASAATTLTKLTVGTNGQVLRANSATATGLEWGNDYVGTVTTVTSSTGALTVATATTTPALTIRSATTSVDGIVQLSDSTSTTSSVLAATPTAVKAAYDLAALALPKAGGTFTGELLFSTTGTLVFEGSTDDAFETTLAVADPTADRTVTLPDATGTVALTSDLDDGTY